ncbi:MAG: hypothetical protein Q8P56_03200 [Candidatus Uhrbacteria bacterium]|nr:hypothetical protein [Candidatus Uhrbacteria bacterium]
MTRNTLRDILVFYRLRDRERREKMRQEDILLNGLELRLLQLSAKPIDAIAEQVRGEICILLDRLEGAHIEDREEATRRLREMHRLHRVQLSPDIIHKLLQLLESLPRPKKEEKKKEVALPDG